MLPPAGPPPAGPVAASPYPAASVPSKTYLTLAIISLISGVAAIALYWTAVVLIAGGAAGLVLGIVSLKRKRNWIAIVGIVLSSLALAFVVFWVVALVVGMINGTLT